MQRRVAKGTITLILLLVGLFVFELFNYHTSRIALDDIFTAFGAVTLGGRTVTLGTLLAVGAAMIDIGGILRIFTPEQNHKNEPDWVRSAYTFWLVATVINTGLTYWVTRLGLESARRIPPELADSRMYIAMVIATFVWIIRYSLVRNVATTGDKYFHVWLPNVNLPQRTKPTKPRPATMRGEGLLDRLPPFFPSPPKKDTAPSLPKKGRSKKWSKDDFMKAVKENPRLKKRTHDEIADIARVSTRTARRWLNEVT